MDRELGSQLALEVEANLVALRFKKQLDSYRDNRETITGCQLVAGLLAFLAIGALASAEPVAAGAIFVAYLSVGFVILPVCNRRNTRAWESMALPLFVLSACEDLDILDERTLQSHLGDQDEAAGKADRRWPRELRRRNVEQLGGWLAARGLCVRLPSAEGTPCGFIRTSLGARMRRRLDVKDLLPVKAFHETRRESVSPT